MPWELVFLMVAASTMLEPPAFSPLDSSTIVTESYERRAWSCNERTLQMDRLVSLAKELRANERGRGRIVIHRYGSDKDYVRIYGSKGIVDSNFANWRFRVGQMIADGFHPPTAFAEIMLVDGQAVVRLRVHGKISRQVVGARDPLTIAIPGGKCEILHFFARPNADRSVRRSDVAGLECRDCIGYLTIALKCTREVTQDDAHVVLRYLERLWPSPKEAVVCFRTDEFFYDLGEFPMLYAFGESKDRPWERESEPSPTGCYFLPDSLRGR